MDEVVVVNDLAKKYGETVALAGLSLSAKKGEVLGVAGPNGAGKTTLVKILVGVTLRDSGDVRVFGWDPSTEGLRIRKSISIVHQRGGMDPFLTAWDNFGIYLRLRGLDVKRGLARARALSERFGINDLLHRPLVTLSGGESRKVQLVRVFLHDSPRLLIMDEPTVGLDPASRRVLWDHVRYIATSLGTTILWTTHDLHEMESVSDRIAVIRKGRCLALGTVNELSELVFGRVVEVHGEIPDSCRSVLDKVPGVNVLSITPCSAVLVVEPGQEVVPLITEILVQNGCRIDSLTRRTFSLEEAFLQLTEEGD